jgi:choline dehydrogenase
VAAAPAAESAGLIQGKLPLPDADVDVWIDPQWQRRQRLNPPA